MGKIYSRLGDGWVTELTETELMKDIVNGTQSAAKNAQIDPLIDDEINHLFDICKSGDKGRKTEA